MMGLWSSEKPPPFDVFFPPDDADTAAPDDAENMALKISGAMRKLGAKQTPDAAPTPRDYTPEQREFIERVNSKLLGVPVNLSEK